MKEQYNKEKYFGILAGTKAKLSLILRGSFDIVNFDNCFLIRNLNNKDDIEYTWGGVIPPEGKLALIMFSKKEAIWSFNHTIKLTSNNKIRNTRYYLPIEFIGGNNEIIEMKQPISSQATKIEVDAKNRRYIIEFINTNYNEVEISIKGKLKNRCKGGWNVDLTDEEVDKLMPRKDIEDKEQLKVIAKRIIEEFDEENKDSDFEYLDYMKIGFWVYKNIQYDYWYLGKTQYSAIDIYNMKKGVCHHFTRLSNALLYSLGYKVIYIAGFGTKNSKTFSTRELHAYSLIKINNKWYPFDSTWGIFTGKLHLGHVFRNYDIKNEQWSGGDWIRLSMEIKGEFIK